jgi:hypothetical protein
MSEADELLGELLRELDDWLRLRTKWWDSQGDEQTQELKKLLKRYEAPIAKHLRRYVLAVIREEAE